MTACQDDCIVSNNVAYVIYKERLYFKTDYNTRTDYTYEGMKPFRPNAKQTFKNYYEVPVDVMEDPDTLADWAWKVIGLKVLFFLDFMSRFFF